MTHPLCEGRSRYPVVNGRLLTPEFMSQTEVFNDVLYRRHPNGGGYVAENALVPLELCVPVGIYIGPRTELLDDKNLAGLMVVKGNMWLDSGRRTPISREIVLPSDESVNLKLV